MKKQKKQKEKPFRTREQFLAFAQKSISDFLEEQRTKQRYYQIRYLRGEPIPSGNADQKGALIMGKGDRRGVFLAWEDDAGGINWGYSLAHPKKESRGFSREEGLLKAIQRSKNGGDSVKAPPEFVIQIQQFIAETVQSCDEWHQKRENRKNRQEGAEV